jgi:hypothetical protein
MFGVSNCYTVFPNENANGFSAFFVTVLFFLERKENDGLKTTLLLSYLTKPNISLLGLP